MTDIVKRLRDYGEDEHLEAADEIERLRAYRDDLLVCDRKLRDEIEELRETHEIDRAFIETQKDTIVKLRKELQDAKVALQYLKEETVDEIERLHAYNKIAHKEVDRMLVEKSALKAEIEQLRVMLDQPITGSVSHKLAEAADEIERLRNDIATERDAWAKDCAEIERLQARCATWEDLCLRARAETERLKALTLGEANYTQTGS